MLGSSGDPGESVVQVSKITHSYEARTSKHSPGSAAMRNDLLFSPPPTNSN